MGWLVYLKDERNVAEREKEREWEREGMSSPPGEREEMKENEKERGMAGLRGRTILRHQ